MNLTDPQIVQMLADFEKKSDLGLLEQALQAIETAGQGVSGGGAAMRRQSIARWLRLFAVLERSIDPEWDEEDVPQSSLVPPPTHDGVTYPSGVDPAAIHDPLARRAYEKALKANREHAERYYLQLQLRQVDDRAGFSFRQMLVVCCAGSPEARRAFEQELSVSGLSASQQARLRALWPE